MRERLGSVDATWFGMDQVENTADVVALLAFRRLPRFDLLRARLEERLVTCPRFRQRVVSGLAGPRWEDAPGFDLDRHLVASRLPDGPEALARRASAMATAPLDPAHPLWRMEAVENERDAALLVKVHHCLADGFALVSLLLALADEAPPAAGAHAVAAYRRLAPWLDPARELWPALVRPGGARDLALQAAAIGAALARLTALRAHPASALDRPLSGIRRLAWSAGAPLAAVRAAARRHGGTVHDVLLEALAGALRATV